MRELFVECDEVGDVDVAIVLLREDILSDLVTVHTSAFYTHVLMARCIPVDEDILQVELEYEVQQLLLDLPVALCSTCTPVFAEQTERVH